MCGGVCDSPSQPDLDYPRGQIVEASSRGYAAGEQDLAFRQGVYNRSQPREQQLYDLASNVAGRQYGVGGAAANFAGGQREMYSSAFAPNEINMVADAYGAGYLSDTERAQLNQLLTGGGTGSQADRLGQLQEFQRSAENAAALQAQQQAGGQINQAFGQQARQLTRYGGDMNRMAQAAAGLANQQALARVHAANMARDSVRAQGLAARQGVANFGRNLPNTMSQAYGLATAADSSAVANQGAGFAAGLPYAQLVTGGYGTQLSAAGLAGSNALGIPRLQAQMYSADVGASGQSQQGLFQGLGYLGGSMMKK